MFLVLKSFCSLFQCSAQQVVVRRYTDCWKCYQISMEIRENGKSGISLFLIHMRKLSSLYNAYTKLSSLYNVHAKLSSLHNAHAKLSSLYNAHAN